VNEVPCSNAVTRKTVAGSRGCSTRTALPRSNAPESSLVTLFIEAVQVGHCSTSTSTDQTASGVASMSIAVRYWGRSSSMADKVRSE
jgi:hypothetical protein